MTLVRLVGRLERASRLSDKLSDSNLLGFFLIAFGLLSTFSLVWIAGFADGPGDLLYRWPGLPSLSLCLFFISRIVSGLLHDKGRIWQLRRKAAIGLLAFAWLVCLPVFLILGGALWYQGWGILGVLGWVGLLAPLLCIALVVRRYSGSGARG